MSRIWAREKAMQLVYQMELNSVKSDEVLNDFLENTEDEVNIDDKEYVENCILGIEKNIKDIDSYIQKYLKGWKIGRIARVDHAIMRLAIYEMIYRSDIPDVVAVNEAIEIAKKYSEANSSSFINGILGNIIREIENEQGNIRD